LSSNTPSPRDGNYITAFDYTTGAQLWNITLPNGCGADQLVYANGLIYARYNDSDGINKIFSINPATGSETTLLNTTTSASHGLGVTSDYIVYPDDTTLRCYFVANLTQVWSVSQDIAGTAHAYLSPTIVNGNIVVERWEHGANMLSAYYLPDSTKLYTTMSIDPATGGTVQYGTGAGSYSLPFGGGIAQDPAAPDPTHLFRYWLLEGVNASGYQSLTNAILGDPTNAVFDILNVIMNGNHEVQPVFGSIPLIAGGNLTVRATLGFPDTNFWVTVNGQPDTNFTVYWPTATITLWHSSGTATRYVDPFEINGSVANLIWNPSTFALTFNDGDSGYPVIIQFDHHGGGGGGGGGQGNDTIYHNQTQGNNTAGQIIDNTFQIVPPSLRIPVAAATLIGFPFLLLILVLIMTGNMAKLSRRLKQ
jgi:hypothetical protein